MAYAFADAIIDASADLIMSGSASIDQQVAERYCREVYHELIHSKPDLQSSFDPATGIITDLPESLPNTAITFPDQMDNRRVPILALLRAKLTKQFLTSDTQIARFKIDAAEFNEEQGVTKPR